MMADLIDMEFFVDALEQRLIWDNMMRLEDVADTGRVVHIGGYVHFIGVGKGLHPRRDVDILSENNQCAHSSAGAL